MSKDRTVTALLVLGVFEMVIIVMSQTPRIWP